MQVVVGEARDRGHLQRSVFFQVRQHLWRSVYEKVDQRWVRRVIAAECPDVGEGIGFGVGPSQLTEMTVGRDPGGTTRERRSPAQLIALLQQQHRGATVGGEHRGNQPGRAATDHDDVEHFLPLMCYGVVDHVVTHQCPPWPTRSVVARRPPTHRPADRRRCSRPTRHRSRNRWREFRR